MHVISLIFTALGVNSADDKLMIFFLSFFPRRTKAYKCNLIYFHVGIPVYFQVGIPGLGERRRKKLGLRKLQEMNLAQIQVLYNDLQTQIESKLGFFNKYISFHDKSENMLFFFFCFVFFFFH